MYPPGITQAITLRVAAQRSRLRTMAAPERRHRPPDAPAWTDAAFEGSEDPIFIEALRSREEQYRVIFDGSADALALWNDALRIVDINPAFARMFGYAREQIIGSSLPSNIDPHERERRIQGIRAALAGREGSIETRGVRQDGST